MACLAELRCNIRDRKKLWILFFFLMMRRPPRSTLFLYTTLFRSVHIRPVGPLAAEDVVLHLRAQLLGAHKLDAGILIGFDAIDLLNLLAVQPYDAPEIGQQDGGGSPACRESLVLEGIVQDLADTVGRRRVVAGHRVPGLDVTAVNRAVRDRPRLRGRGVLRPLGDHEHLKIVGKNTGVRPWAKTGGQEGGEAKRGPG